MMVTMNTHILFSKSHLVLVLFVPLLILTGCDLNQEVVSNAQDLNGGTWITLESAPVATQEIGVAELNGEIYVLGGILGNRTIGRTVQIYNPDSDTWRRGANMPSALHHMGVASANGKLYVVGGYQGNFNPVNTMFEYDPAADQWSAKAPLPNVRGGLSAVEIEGLIYAVGGARGRSVADLTVYDPTTDEWTTLASMDTSRDHLTAAAIDSKLYAIGGRNQGNFTLATLEVYDPATNQWSTLAPMPTGRSGIAGAALNGCLYVMGGEGNRLDVDGIFPQVERYDPSTNEWTAITPMKNPRHGIGAVAIGNRIHVPAGGPVEGFGVTDLNDALEAPDDVRCGE
jgi:N-acetylneuraminic acid mutarotase